MQYDTIATSSYYQYSLQLPYKTTELTQLISYMEFISYHYK